MWSGTMNGPDEGTRYLQALGTELRRLRARRGWTRRELRDRLQSDISLQTLATYELGTRQCSVVRLVELCLALGEQPDRLLFRVHRRASARLPGELSVDGRVRVDLRALAHSDQPALASLRRWALMRLSEVGRSRYVLLDQDALRWLAQLCGMSGEHLIDLLARNIQDCAAGLLSADPA